MRASLHVSLLRGNWKGEAMKLYIAGPMRGQPLYNFPKFFEVALALRALGHEVVNPAEHDMAKGFNPALPMDHADQISFSMEDTLRSDFMAILKADGIVMLPGWEESSGARDEFHLASRAGRCIYYWNANRSALVAVQDVDSRIYFPQLDPQLDEVST